MPSSIVLPYDANVRNASIAKSQLNMNEELKSMLWKKFVQKKIENQAKYLTLLWICNCKKHNNTRCSMCRVLSRNWFYIMPV